MKNKHNSFQCTCFSLQHRSWYTCFGGREQNVLFEDKKCSEWWEQHALNKHKSFRHLSKLHILNLSDSKLGWSNNLKIHRPSFFFFLNPAFRIYVLIVHQIAVDGKSLSDWPKSELNNILEWTVPSLCSSKPALSLKRINIYICSLAFCSWWWHGLHWKSHIWRSWHFAAAKWASES